MQIGTLRYFVSVSVYSVPPVQQVPVPRPVRRTACGALSLLSARIASAYGVFGDPAVAPARTPEHPAPRPRNGQQGSRATR